MKLKPKPSGLSLLKKQHSIWRVLLLTCVLIAIGALVAVYIYQQIIPRDHQAKVPTETAEQEQEDDAQQEAPEYRAAPAATPASQPHSITIPSVGVHRAAIVPVGIEPNGDMATPPTNHGVGWYDKSAQPADGTGTLLLNGHVGIGSQEAVFKQLHRLSVGEVIEVQTGDGTSYRYEVYHIERLPLEDVDMRKMIRSVNPSKQGLNIITCAGEYDDARATYDDRVLVYAVRSDA